jgi:hypothetical protein
MTISVSRVDDTMPPIIGTAMRGFTSAPMPWLHIIGRRPAMTCIIFGRSGSTAPLMIAARRSSCVEGAPFGRAPLHAIKRSPSVQ